LGTRSPSLNCRARTADEAVTGQRCPTLALDVPTRGLEQKGSTLTHGSADTRSDADLLAAHAAGDADAFGEVVRRHRDRLWAVALRTLGDREEAADAVQDALVSALRASGPRAVTSADGPAGPGFRGEAAVTTWLHRIVVNACLDRVRRKSSRPADPLPDYDVPDRRPDPLAARELALDLDAALATLPADQRAALVLVDMYGYPVDEVASILDCPVGTVKSRCARGRARLVPLLRPDLTGPPDSAGADPVGAAGNPLDAARVPPERNVPASAEGGDPHR
jgi:RNA polymerase sigma-70 factor, ECF subfamily